MISDARGGHVSPGIYTEEREVSYSVKSLGITNLGLVGEALKGPAFQAIPIESWSDYTDYFGGTSTEKHKGTGMPKYEMSYVAKSYLQESKRLQVVRILGLSGYIASKPWVVTAKFDDGVSAMTYPVAVLRSMMEYGKGEDECTTANTEVVSAVVSSIEIAPYTGTTYGSSCEVISAGTPEVYSLSGTVIETEGGNVVSIEGDNELGKFALNVKYADTTKKDDVIFVSLNPNDNDYIYEVLSAVPNRDSKYPIYVESVYDYSYDRLVQNSETGTTVELGITGVTGHNDYREPFRCAETPWIVSQLASSSVNRVDMKKLFKFFTISDGNASNYQVKISIQNIKPEDYTFDVVIRDFYDTDAAPIILEKYSKCTLKEGDKNFIGLKIGTFDGGYETKSKYVTVLINENNESIEKCVPAGFLGYPVPYYLSGMTDSSNVDVCYNTVYNADIKSKRQYFGMTEHNTDTDILNYMGVDAYSPSTYDANPELITNGFHLDSIMSDEIEREEELGVYVDGVSGFNFTTVSAKNAGTIYTKIPRILTENYMEETIYNDVNLRKFTVYPYGGFDGWDVFRASGRTNTDAYRGNKYKLSSDEETCPFKKIGSGEGELNLNPLLNLNLPANAITTDYYAYLAGYRQFANPQDIEINLFATPGIDWVNQTSLFEDALDMIEDSEDGRGGDALYIVTTPQRAIGKTEDYTEDEIAGLMEDYDINTSYACTYWPWVKYFDKDEKIYINLPVTKDVVRNMAYTDNHLFPWYAPAGVLRGTVDCTRACKKTTLSSEDTLYNACINPIKTFSEDGVIVWGNKTMYSEETPLNRVNVRRLMIRVKKLVVGASKELIFEQYDDTLEKQFRSIVEPILKNVKENRGISDYRLVIECTDETKDQHILPAKILIKPINALEYISISFVVYPESVEFDENL